MAPWYDDRAVITEIAVNGSLDRLHALKEARYAAGYDNGKRMSEWLVLGCVYFDTCGNIGMSTKKISNEPVLDRQEMNQLQGCYSFGMGWIAPKEHHFCQHCRRGWTKFELLDFECETNYLKVDADTFKLDGDSIIGWTLERLWYALNNQDDGVLYNLPREVCNERWVDLTPHPKYETLLINESGHKSCEPDHVIHAGDEITVAQWKFYHPSCVMKAADDGSKLAKFKAVSHKMLWRNAAMRQFEEFEKLAENLGVEIDVVGSHTSKSIQLPVVELRVDGCRFLLRDNFYDVNIHVAARTPLWLSLDEMFDEIYKPLDWDWYLGEIERARGYSWRAWSDEQMDDPMVLHVAEERNGRIIDWNKTRGEKERWIKRMFSPEWWEKDWSGGSLCWDGEFGPGVKMYCQARAFAEGIPSLVAGGTLVPYNPRLRSFILAVGSIESAEKIIRRVVGAMGGE